MKNILEWALVLLAVSSAIVILLLFILFILASVIISLPILAVLWVIGELR